MSQNIDPDSRERSTLYAESTLLKSATETIGFLMVVCSADSFWAQLSQEGYLLDEVGEVRIHSPPPPIRLPSPQGCAHV